MIWDPKVLRRPDRGKHLELGSSGEHLATVLGRLKTNEHDKFAKMVRRLKRLFPTVSDIIIDPTDPITTDRLNVNYTFNDIDGDGEDRSNTVVKWLLWNEILKEFLDTGYRGHNLSSEFTAKGEIWMCEVIPHDGKDAGISNQSLKNVTINNSAPSVSNVRITH